jgi:hypothetical protein
MKLAFSDLVLSSAVRFPIALLGFGVWSAVLVRERMGGALAILADLDTGESHTADLDREIGEIIIVQSTKIRDQGMGSIITLGMMRIHVRPSLILCDLSNPI